jgi:23S rRNA (cytidine1920-2'-O)/16S rRNA (cytidine1409-2'-O)-methyltransferase
MAKKRADVVLFEKGLVESREKAKRVIMEGAVFVGTDRVDKPGESIEETAEIWIKKNPIKFVSRGGLKLEKAIECFHIDLSGVIAMDMGASTGGFTDCMLREGAKKVYAVDVGYGQLDWKLRQDTRVVVKERTNIRYMQNSDVDDMLDFVSIDVSFISLKHILPVAFKLLKDDGKIVALIKPQFEAGRDKVGKKGIVKDKLVHKEVIENVLKFSEKILLYPVGLTFSPITGTTGNVEFLACFSKKENYIDNNDIDRIIEEAHTDLK